MLTQSDIDEIEDVVRDIVREETKNLPSKDEFYTKMDKVMGELKNEREE